MDIQQHPDFHIKKILLNDRISVLLSTYITTWESITLEQSLPWWVVEWLKKSDLEAQRLFEDVSWQRGKRMCKSPQAIQYTREAIQKTEEIWEWIEDIATSWEILWLTELELRWKIIQKALRLGCEDEAFPTIVASGAHSALPHHATSATKIQAWPLLVDMWFRWHGWCSDFTRVVWVWNDGVQWVSRNEFEDIVSIVQQAHDTARDMVALWVAFQDIAVAARRVIEAAWYGDYFPHSLWHGVWLDVHEAPGVSSRSKDRIEKGMIFTIEPGIYLPGKFGVRWENIVIV